MLFTALPVIKENRNAGYQRIPFSRTGKQEYKAADRHLQIAQVFQHPGSADGENTDGVVIGLKEFCEQAEDESDAEIKENIIKFQLSRILNDAAAFFIQLIHYPDGDETKGKGKEDILVFPIEKLSLEGHIEGDLRDNTEYKEADKVVFPAFRVLIAFNQQKDKDRESDPSDIP